ncbi:phage holin [Macrococcus bovicus]|uniref:phage holin n=1 Tax=Macrococcus bovicus TaxID=69968 RepID=UPI0025A58BD1|nr:phage holin [Macrococcus bovicus]WJP97054.1 phage holin [Macrococcus bovicus]
MGGVKKQVINESHVTPVINDKQEQELKKQVDQEAIIDLIKQAVGIVSALLPFLAFLQWQPEWLTENNLQQFVVVSGLIVAFLFNVYSIYKNHYSGKHARVQKLFLKKKGLK